jgi:hypothetical protein
MLAPAFCPLIQSGRRKLNPLHHTAVGSSFGWHCFPTRQWQIRADNSEALQVRRCGARGRHIDVRPNWKEQPPGESLTGKQWR